MSKFYWEVTCTENGGSSINQIVGVISGDHLIINTFPGNDAAEPGIGFYDDGRTEQDDGGATLYGGAWGVNDVVSIALDALNGAVWFGINGTWQAGATEDEIASGDTTNAAGTWVHTAELFPAWWGFHQSPEESATANFGATPYVHAVPTGFGNFRVGNTWNQNDKDDDVILSEGFLNAQIASTNGFSGTVRSFFGTQAPPFEEKKFYWEVLIGGDNLSGQQVGVEDQDHSLVLGIGLDPDETDTLGIAYVGSSGHVQHNVTTASFVGSYGATFTTGDRIGVAMDAARFAVWFSKNGVWQGGANVQQIENGDTSKAAAVWSPARDQERGMYPATFLVATEGGGLFENATLTLAPPFTYTKPGGFDPFLKLPSFAVRAGFVTPTWAEISSKYSWAQLESGFTWEDIQAGPVADQDVVRFNSSRNLGTAIQRLNTGDATLVLDDSTSNYTPESQSTPYDLRPGKRLMMKVRTAAPTWDPNAKTTDAGSLTNGNLTITATGTLSAVRAGVGTEDTEVGSMAGIFAGYIEQYDAKTDIQNRRTVITAHDVGDFMRPTLNTELQKDIQIGSLTTIVASAIGLPPHHFDNQITMVNTVPYAALDNITGGEAVHQIIESGGHAVFIDGAGKVQFRSRNAEAAATVVASYVSNFQMFTALAQDDEIYTEARVGMRGRDAQAISSVAAITMAPQIPASGSITFYLNYRDPITLDTDVAVQSLATPVSSTDWRMEDLAASDVTATGSVSVTGYATQAKVVAFNGQGTTAQLVKFVLLGGTLRPTAVYISHRIDSSAEDLFQQRLLDFNSLIIGDPTYAGSYAAYLVARYARTRHDVAFEQKNRYPDILRTELLDAVHLVESHSNVATNYVITGIENAITFDETGTQHSVIYRATLQVNST